MTAAVQAHEMVGEPDEAAAVDEPIERLSDEALDALRLKFPGAVELVIDGLGCPVVKPFDQESAERWIDELAKHHGVASHNAVARHMLYPTLADLSKIRRYRSGVDDEILNRMAEGAGCPTPDASVIVEPLTASTPPGVLERAGLTAEQAAKLHDALDRGREAVVYLIPDDAGETRFACVLGTPREADMVILDRANSKKEGLAEALRKAAIGAVLWCREGAVVEVFKRPEFCVVPGAVMFRQIYRMGSQGAARRSKSGPRRPR